MKTEEEIKAEIEDTKKYLRKKSRTIASMKQVLKNAEKIVEMERRKKK